MTMTMTITIDISNAYRAVNTYLACSERHGLAWDFRGGIVYLRDSNLYVFSKLSDFPVRCMVRAGYSECINYLDDFCVIGHSEAECADDFSGHFA